MARICSRVLAATYCDNGASLSTMETVETESPQARATSSNRTWLDLPGDIFHPEAAKTTQRYSAIAGGDSHCGLALEPFQRMGNAKILGAKADASNRAFSVKSGV
jgi:hypothetical protein